MRRNRLLKMERLNELRKEMRKRGLHYHHTSMKRGYFKVPQYTVDWGYKGQFGEGVAMEHHTDLSNGYHLIEYWTKEPPDFRVPLKGLRGDGVYDHVDYLNELGFKLGEAQSKRLVRGGIPPNSVIVYKEEGVVLLPDKDYLHLEYQF